ncbi:MAG: uroporphyrinogen decarboxylase family protein [Planctomycetota bacterium]
MTMTSRERWQAVLRRAIPDRIPTDFWSTGEVITRLKQDLGCGDDDAVFKKLHIDRIRGIGPRHTGARDGYKPENIWQLKYQKARYEGGEYAEVIDPPPAHMTTAAEIKAFRWPRADWYDYANLKADADKLIGQGWPVTCGYYEPFHIYANMHGQEQAYMDLAIAPEIIDTALGFIADFWFEQLRRSIEAVGPGKVDVTYVAEDLGSQSAPLMSMEHFRTFLKPRMKRQAQLALKHGVAPMTHSDGAVRVFIPEFIDLGTKILNPVQWRYTGMEREPLKKDFGAKLIFHGTVDNQETLPFGSVKDVVNEVKENIRIFGAGGGFILAPCHNLQPVTSTEKIVAMYATAHAEGVY